MDLSKIWDTGWVQGTILVAAVLAAVAVAYAIRL
jgi:hypothetical protein